MQPSEILNNSNATTIVSNMTVFDPLRDLQPSYVGIPDLWASSLEAVAPTITEKIGEQAAAGETWADTLQRMLPILAMTVQQREILKIQLERARAGLPPLPNSDFGAQVSVGLDPQTRNLLLYGGLALAALLAFRYMKRGS